MSNIERYYLSSDNSGHKYAVPVSKTAEWREWNNLDEDDPTSWNPPEYAIHIDGRFTFTDPRTLDATPSPC